MQFITFIFVIDSQPKNNFLTLCFIKNAIFWQTCNLSKSQISHILITIFPQVNIFCKGKDLITGYNLFHCVHNTQ